MKVFGDTQIFAIQTGLEYVTESTTTIGHICLWISGIQIGDYDDVTVLGSCSAGVNAFIKNTGSRSDPKLANMSDSRLLVFIRSAVYGDARGLIEDGECYENRFKKFVFCPDLGEPFEGDFVIALDIRQRIRFVWQERETEALRTAILPAKDCLDVCRSFHDWELSFSRIARQ